MIASAVLFLFVLFLIKDTAIFKNTTAFIQNKQGELTYDSTATLGDLVANDADGDGIPDWEEPLYGLDPTKKETTPGIPDSTALSKLTAGRNNSGEIASGEAENLTQTDKFSRELFATVASLNQSGATLDQATADKIGSSLADEINNYAPKKVFLTSDITIDPSQTTKNYRDALTNIYGKIKIPEETAMEVLQKFAGDGSTIDASALRGLDPIVKNANEMIAAIAKIKVPPALATLHVDLLNGLERVAENLSDISLYESDPIIALAGMNQYEENSASLISANNNLYATINKK